MTDRLSCVDTKLPKWVPIDEECVWCRRHTQQPVEVELTDEDCKLYYQCSNEECEHQKRYKSPALYGLVFSNPKFAEQYLSFITEPEEEK